MHFIAARYLRSSLPNRRQIHRTRKALALNLQACYKILAVTPSSTQEEIKDAYIEKCKKYHPDLHQGNLEMQQRFIEVNEAYHTLSKSPTPYNNETGFTGYRHTAPDFHAFYPKWKTKEKQQPSGPEFDPFRSNNNDRLYENNAHHFKKGHLSEENKTETRNLYKLFIFCVLFQFGATFVYYSFFKGRIFTFDDRLKYDRFPQEFVITRFSYRDKAEATKRMELMSKNTQSQPPNDNKTDHNPTQT